MTETDDTTPANGAEDASAPAEAAEEPTTGDAEAPEETPEAGAADDADDADGAQPAAPSAPTHPKERRKWERSRQGGDARPSREPDERAAERADRRRQRAAARRAWRAKQRESRGADRAAPGAPEPTPPAREHGPGRPRERHGVVVSDRPDKTITVRIDVARQHPTYGKIVRNSSTLHAHDERNEAHAGDTVRVVESRPLSRTKRWRLVEVTERAR